MNADPDMTMRQRRVVITVVLVGVAFGLLLGLPTLAHLFTDARWFASVGRWDVFSTILWTRIGLGVAVGTAVAIVLLVNVHLAVRLSRGLPSLRLHDPNLATLDLGEHGPRLLRFAPWLVGLVAGLSASRQWGTWLRFSHGADFGHSDPIFDRDIGFYVFDFPVLDALHSLLSWTVVLSMLLAGGIYLLRGGLVWTGRSLTANRRARGHMSVLVAMLFGLFAFDAWLSTAELLYSRQGPVAGASYSDVQARLPMLRAEIGVAALGAVLILISITRQRLVLAGAAVVLYLAVAILGVRVYPSMVQRFSVDPNEAVKEAPYIEHNIEATRMAYGLDGVAERDLSGDLELTLEDVENNRTTVDNVRLWDHEPLLDTFAQIQEIRTYYEFASVDNDRYSIGGQLRQIMLSPRELAVQNLPNRTWINERFTFTHGYGLTLGPVNQATKEGLPVLYIKDIPPQSSVPPLEVSRPGIYFGELSSNYVFVRSNKPEFDHPSGEENVHAHYEGKAGVSLDSALIRTAVALRVGSLKLLLSDDLTDDSGILLYRNVPERVRQVAPFLDLDRDPYIIVRDDGRLAWIQDAYTSTGLYPYAEPARAGLNYMRNSVKAVVDAYDGTVELYAVDPTDPILATWQRAFPEMFLPLSEMPADIRAHLRHPEDLFRIQTEMFAVYHMDRPDLVYNREDQWEIPVITQGRSSQRMEPYYTVMRLPGEEEAEFIFMLPFTPKNKDNLAAWMVARNDGDRLGELVVYRFPRDRLVFGPSQIMNRINQDAEISRQITLWNQQNSRAIIGTLLVIPIEESLVYVCPLYLKSENGRIPELKRVIAAYGNDIAMERTLDEALATVLGDHGARPGTDEERADAPSTSAAEGDEESPDEAAAAAAAEPAADSDRAAGRAGDLRVRANDLFDRAVAAQREGDWARYGEELAELERVLRQLAADARPPDPDARAPRPEQAAPESPAASAEPAPQAGPAGSDAAEPAAP